MRVIREVSTDEDATSLPRAVVGVPHALNIPFTLSVTNPRAELLPGHTVGLIGVSPLDSATVVSVAVFDVESDATFAVDGSGPGWVSVREVGGEPTFELVWADTNLPSDLPLVARGTVSVQAS